MGKEISQERKYYSISEVSEICEVKPHTLRFWEKEFKDLKPITRKGSRRYYQKHDINLIKQIQSLLYQDGMTISGAKKNLQSSNDEQENDEVLQSAVDDLEDLLARIK